MVHVCPKTAEEAKPPVTRESVLSLHEITEDNWRAVIQLKTKPEQAGNLASNAVSIVEGHYSEDAWFRAIYADNHTVIGFLMLAIWDPTEMYYIWRFMIDQRYQGLGFGKQGVALAVAKIREHAPKAKLIRVMSTAPEGQTVEGRPEKTVKPEDSPYHFYTKLGFREISGPDEDGEHELAMEL